MKTPLTLEQKKQLSKNLASLIEQKVLARDTYAARKFLKQKKALDKEINEEREP